MSLFKFGFSRSKITQDVQPSETDQNDTTKKRKLETPREKEVGSGLLLACPNDKSYRHFRPEWKEGRPWLLYEKSVMICDICRKYDSTSGKGKNSFIDGSSNYRTSAIRDHEKCQAHVRACSAKLAVEKPDITPLMKGLSKMSEHEKRIMLKLFTTALFLALNDRPYSDFQPLLHLQTVNFGTDLLQRYANNKQAATFIKFIAEAIRLDTKSKLCESPFYSIIMDGSTDTGNIEQEIIYVKFFNVETCLPECKFIAYRSVVKADAVHLVEALSLALTENADYPNWHDSLVSCTADGAAVNFGVNSGVITRLKHIKPYVIGLHCTAHRLELAIKSACTQSSYMETVNQFLENIYKLYHNSPQNWAALEESGKTHSLTVKRLTKAHGTRWVAHTERALQSIIHNWPALVEHLMQLKITDKSEKGNKAAGFYETLTSLRFVLFSHMLLKCILPQVSILSCILQENTSSINDVTDRVKACQSMMCSVDPLVKLTKFVKDKLDNELKYHGYKLTLSGQTRSRGSKKLSEDDVIKQVAAESKHLVDSIVGTIETRFEDFLSESENILGCFQIFVPVNWPVSPESLSKYGHVELEKLLNHFNDILIAKHFDNDIDKCQMEFLDLLIYSQRLCKSDTNLVKSPCALWSQVIKNKYEPDGETPFSGSAVLALVVIMLVIAVASAEPERGFSHMGNIKSDCRSLLKTDNLNDLMTIKMSDIKLESTTELCKALDLWYADKSRRKVNPHGSHARKTENILIGDSDSD